MRLTLCILTIILSLNLFAQKKQTLPKDKSDIEVRQFDKDKINDYKEKEWFDYEEPSKPLSGFWEWLFEKIFRLLRKIFSNQGSTPYYRNTIAVVVILVVVYVLFRHYISGLFQTGNLEDKIEFEEVSDDIYANDLDKLLEKAIREQAYRHAVRILFLKFVRQLSDKKYIDWKLEKTNHQYWHEIQQENILAQFKKLTVLYEYVWYGEFQVDQNKFKTIHENFNTANKIL